MSNLLSVPFRECEHTPIGESIGRVIAAEFFQTPTSFSRDIELLDFSRQAIEFLEPSTSKLTSLNKYYVQLVSLETKFPDECVDVTWNDTILQKEIRSRSLEFEKDNVAFQIAAMYSMLGLQESKLSDEGFKKSALYFQYAAGSFRHILRVSPTDTIESLSYLMLAHAQETYWLKAVRNKLKDSLVARLAEQVAEFYNEALQKIPKKWASHVTMKLWHFRAASQYRMAMVALERGAHGEEVCRLRKAKEMIFKTFSRNSEQDDSKGLGKIIDDTLKVAERDNDLIYFQHIPQFEDLPPINCVSMVKPLESSEFERPLVVLDTTPTYGGVLFKSLLPYTVIQSAQAFRERQDQFVDQQLIVPYKALTRILKKFLQERQIPASLDAFQKPQSLPVNVIEQCQFIRDNAGLVTIDQSFDELKRLSIRGSQLLIEAQSRLGDDNVKVSKLREYMSQAESGDDAIRKQYSDLKPILCVMSSADFEPKIKKLLPWSGTSHVDGELKKLVTALRDCLQEAERIEEKRKCAVEGVDSKNSRLNILPKVIEAYRESSHTDSFEPVYREQLKNFDEDIMLLTESKVEQQKLERKIQSLWDKFQAHGSLISKERQEMLQKLNDGYEGFIEISENLQQGIHFYNDFIGNVSGILG